MARNTADLPTRVTRQRFAKEKATLEIRKYFQPKSHLQVISEDNELVYSKKSVKDTNNNTKRNFKQVSEGYQETDINAEGKRKKVTAKATLKTSTASSKSSTASSKSSTASSKSSNAYSESSSILKASSTAKASSISKAASSSTVNSSSSAEVIFMSEEPKKKNTIIIINSSITSNDSHYDFDALNTDDPTDTDDDDDAIEDDKKRPYWSMSHNRVAIVIDQITVNNKTVETFFGSKAENVDSVDIFPKIERMKRRRSTAVWNTPPRYSMLPKY